MKPEKKAVELSEDAKLILTDLKASGKLELNELKERSGFSNKKWDKAIKDLTKNDLAKVEKTEEGLWVTVI